MRYNVQNMMRDCKTTHGCWKGLEPCNKDSSKPRLPPKTAGTPSQNRSDLGTNLLYLKKQSSAGIKETWL